MWSSLSFPSTIHYSTEMTKSKRKTSRQLEEGSTDPQEVVAVVPPTMSETDIIILAIIAMLPLVSILIAFGGQGGQVLSNTICDTRGQLFYSELWNV